jgi:SAM-dependent methyltransferase
MSTYLDAERSRSAFEASQFSRSSSISDTTFNRYRCPDINTAYPLEYVFAMTHRTPGVQALDLGCGSGVNSILLDEQGWNVRGYDVSPELIALAAQRTKDRPIHVAVADAHDIPEPDASFDLILAVAILHHLDKPRAVTEISRLLRKGGCLVIQEPIRDSKLACLFRRWFPRVGDDISPFEAPLTTAEMHQLFWDFETVRSRAFRLPHVKLAKRLGRRAERWAYQLDGFLLRKFPWLEKFANERVMAVRKV